MKLQFARIFHGSNSHPVKPSERLPIPEQFDFDNPIECAKKIAAIMSFASGGHKMRDVKLRVHRGRRSANIIGNGLHVFYRDPDSAALPATPKTIEEYSRESDVTVLGNVRAKNAWTSPKWTA
ncbi:hypothetical protein [Burkholderia phage vB_BglM_WTB]